MSGQRQHQGHSETAFGPRSELEYAAVANRDCRDDGEPEAQAAARGDSLRAESPERLGELINLVLVEARSSVFDDDVSALVVGTRCDFDESFRLVVPDRVVDDVRHHAGKERLVAAHVGLIEVRPHGETPTGHVARVGSEGGRCEARQRDGVQVGHYPSLCACKDEEAL